MNQRPKNEKPSIKMLQNNFYTHTNKIKQDALAIVFFCLFSILSNFFVFCLFYFEGNFSFHSGAFGDDLAFSS
jgi:hypothetical protein